MGGASGTTRDIGERSRLEQGRRQSQRLEAVGRLAGGLAHDLNNLLTVILVLSQELVIGCRRTIRAGQMPSRYLGAGELAARLTRQVVAFTGRHSIAPRVLDLNAVVETLMPMLRRVIGEDIASTFTSVPERYAVAADPVNSNKS